jgi:hypothetical protein
VAGTRNKKEENLNANSVIRLFSLQETAVAMDTGVTTLSDFYQVDNKYVTRPVRCHQRESFID